MLGEVLRFSPKGVLEVSVEGLVGAVAAQHGHNVPPIETAAAPKGKDRCDLRAEGKVLREEPTEKNFPLSYFSEIQSSSSLVLDRRRKVKSNLHIYKQSDANVMSQREHNTVLQHNDKCLSA